MLNKSSPLCYLEAESSLSLPPPLDNSHTTHRDMIKSNSPASISFGSVSEIKLQTQTEGINGWEGVCAEGEGWGGGVPGYSGGSGSGSGCGFDGGNTDIERERSEEEMKKKVKKKTEGMDVAACCLTMGVGVSDASI
ncbi:unnamed protein product [Ilex paraguariensis]|uniref:Uncharacterized protein n=1 Tax=Ilex paraguariensis TaxID=185542 RepID=A0ABC8S4L2_9AQUA